MESILVLTHADETGSALTKASLEAVTAGQELAGRLSAPLAIGIVSSGPINLSKGLPSARLLAVSGEAFAQPRYATDAAACEAPCRAAAQFPCKPICLNLTERSFPCPPNSKTSLACSSNRQTSECCAGYNRVTSSRKAIASSRWSESSSIPKPPASTSTKQK